MNMETTAVGYLCPSNAEHFQPSLNSNFASECTDFHVIRDTLWSSSGGSGHLMEISLYYSGHSNLSAVRGIQLCCDLPYGHMCCTGTASNSLWRWSSSCRTSRFDSNLKTPLYVKVNML
jgi:hypothetical protein